MEDEIKTLIFNLMCDMKKEEIAPIGRARLIQSYIESTGITGRQLAIRLGIPHSTLQDWLLWTKISQSQYQQYQEQGHTDSDIYRSLRGGTLSGRTKAIDQALQNCISKMELFKIKPPYSGDTKNLINQLKHILEVIENQVK